MAIAAELETKAREQAAKRHSNDASGEEVAYK
jgi:hypothetical protein